MSSTSETPSLTVRLSLSPQVHKRSSTEESELPRLSVHTTLSASQPVTVDIRGPNGSWTGAALAPGQLSSSQFSFINVATGEQVVVKDEEECGEAGGFLGEKGVMTLEPGQEITSSLVLEDAGDIMISKLQAGQEYAVKLLPAKVWWTWGTKADLLQGKEAIPVDEDEIRNGPQLLLDSSDELRLSVEN